MARLYTVNTAALTLGTSMKWLDNVLSHNRVSGVAQRRQGVSRRFTIEGLVALAVVILLVRELGLPTAKTIAVAENLAKNGGRYIASKGLMLTLDLSSFRTDLLE